MPKTVVLAYSGGLDTSCIVPWLRENMDCKVVCFVGDVGQGAEELAGIEHKAINSGAAACHVVDLRRDFIENYVYPTIIAGAMYEGRYLLGTAIARPCLAKGQIDLALQLGADAVAHGCTGKGNDQVRFESAVAALAPHLEIIAPWRKWKLRSREDLLNYLAERKIPTTASATKIYSRDRNLWHISHEGGAIEHTWNPPPEDAWMLTVSPAKAPDAPRDVQLTFRAGRLTAVDGKEGAAEDLVSHLNVIAGPHGVGRVDLVENRLVGMKSRGLYETPGGTVIVEALRGLEELVLDRETLHYREHLGLTFAELVYNGRWFTPLREALWACAENMSQRVTGDVVVRLFKGRAVAIQRRSEYSLYSEEFATFGADEVYDQTHAEGFIRLLSLPERIAAMARRHRAGGR